MSALLQRVAVFLVFASVDGEEGDVVVQVCHVRQGAGIARNSATESAVGIEGSKLLGSDVLCGSGIVAVVDGCRRVGDVGCAWYYAHVDTCIDECLEFGSDQLVACEVAALREVADDEECLRFGSEHLLQLPVDESRRIGVEVGVECGRHLECCAVAHEHLWSHESRSAHDHDLSERSLRSCIVAYGECCFLENRSAVGSNRTYMIRAWLESFDGCRIAVETLIDVGGDGDGACHWHE